MSDIVERLRSRKEPTIEVDMHYPQIVDSEELDTECLEAADLITALRAENERLRAALGEIAAMSPSNTCECEMCIAARIARAALEGK